MDIGYSRSPVPNIQYPIPNTREAERAAGVTPTHTSSDELHPTPWFVDFLGEHSTLHGQPLPVGAVVRAYDPSGVLAGRAEVTLSGWYLLPVYGDDLVTELDEGVESGDSITFTINDHPAIPLGPDPPYASS
ncbi:hypothetical protein KJ830_11255 [bacterium]|nr:hypothetical protein [bacterium]